MPTPSNPLPHPPTTSASPDGDALIFYPRRGRLVVLLLLSVVAIAGCGICFWANLPGNYAQHHAPDTPTLVGDVMYRVMLLAASGIGIPLFAAATVFMARRLLVPAPTLIVDTQGITDSSSLVSAGFVAWEEIERINMYAMQNNQFVGVWLFDPAAFLARVRPGKAFMMNLNQKIGTPAININGAMLGIPPADLPAQIAAYCRAHSVGQHILFGTPRPVQIEMPLPPGSEQ